MPTSDAHAQVNHALRARLGGPQPEQPQPGPVAQAIEANERALKSGDRDAILAADDALAAAVEQASRPPSQPRDWGQGARGTQHTPSGPDLMNGALRGAMNGETRR